MRKCICIIMVLLLLTGCSSGDEALERGMALRAEVIAKRVSFTAKITADYGDLSTVFSMKCHAETDGTLKFEVTEPKSIAGISGTVSAQGGQLTFDKQALAFELMADGQFSPVSAPWVLMKTLRGGYLTSCNREGELLRLAIDDSYADDALHLDIWVDSGNIPQAAEIYWQGRRLLTIELSHYTME